MRNQRLVCVFLLSAVLGMGATPSWSETFTLGPEADAFVSSANPSNNYGGAGAVAISAVGLPQGDFQALFRFDLSGAKAAFDTALGSGNWFLESASLQLTAASPNNLLFNSSAAGQIDFHWMENDTWEEGNGTPNAPGGTGVTWDTLPTFRSANDEALGGLSFDGAVSGTLDYPLTLSSGFNSDAVAGSLATILLTPALGDPSVSALFNSRTFNNPVSRPVLTLSAVVVPEPCSFWLAVMGFAICRIAMVNRKAY